MHRDLPAVDGGAQPGLEVGALQQGGHHFRAEAQVAVLAGRLRRVHGDVGAAEQLGGVDGVFADGCQAQAQAGPQHGAVDPDRELEGFDDPFGGGVGVERADQQDHEFVAAQPCYNVAGPDAGAQPAAHLDQHLVPGVVAVDVVDFLEVVQVQQQDVDGGPARVRPGRAPGGR